MLKINTRRLLVIIYFITGDSLDCPKYNSQTISVRVSTTTVSNKYTMLLLFTPFSEIVLTD